MKVLELIEHLQTMPADVDVVVLELVPGAARAADVEPARLCAHIQAVVPRVLRLPGETIARGVVQLIY